MTSFIASSVGKKYLMGVSGLIWLGFIFVHMAGNLLIFAGPEVYNSYGHAITSNKILLYGAEIILISALLMHIGLGVLLTRQNFKAKASQYSVSGSREKGASFASKTMALHGTVILIFIVSHLITFKFGPYYETTVDGVVMRDLHRLMVEVFSQPVYIAWYIVALVLLGIHVSHGVGSVFQSFGLLHPSYLAKIEKIRIGYAVVVTLGFLSQPVYFFFNKL
ncbi:MAG: succinate dehydrogenase cytochrome b subunit [Bdellovibrionaceae bacterium]|nr:succinate dehydrogenase cytochrome b subunit [Pseudobdellovibrionaceae bacterium]